MVKAILQGEKTMTRRIIKPQPDGVTGGKAWVKKFINVIRNGELIYTDKTEEGKQIVDPLLFPHGQIGDRLWVRETWIKNTGELPTDLGYVYKAELGDDELVYSNELGIKWKPSIFMPREACRMFLKICSIRVERLHDISEQDLIAEGIKIPVNGKGSNRVLLELGGKNKAIDFLPEGCMAPGAEKLTQKQLLFAHFAELWCSINGRESWDSNPWVWVIKFSKENY